VVFRFEFFPFLNFLGVYVVFAIGADDVFVACDKVSQKKHHVSPSSQSFDGVDDSLVRHFFNCSLQNKWKNVRLEHPSATTEQIASLALPYSAKAMFLTSVSTGGCDV
jgi:hypothetical protein